ncbi:MAG: nicotinamide-nucleotide amidohydrolase family protein, partial [Ruminococcaceae bacterium]|nr:nicotinamide-nucleotide amidohydrolase family protein [Oscillospiraceae bacterium]
MNVEILFYYVDSESNAVSRCENDITAFINQISLKTVTATKINSDIREFNIALNKAQQRSNIVFLFSNINVATDAVCNVFNLSRYESTKFPNILSLNGNRKEIFFPEDSSPFIDRETGEAGFIKKSGGKTIVCLPLSDESVYSLLTEYVVPFFSTEFNNYYSTLCIRTFGQNIQKLKVPFESLKRKHRISLNIREENGINDITFSHTNKSFQNGDMVCANVVADLKNILGENIFTIGKKSLATVTVELLIRNALTVATAESCTGGMLSEAITSVKGASNVLEMGVCAYSNRIKNEMLDVDQNILEKFGAISKETAAALAKGVKTKSGASIGIGITGVAGPSASEGKAVGTVYIALYDGKNYWLTLLKGLENKSRDYIRSYAVNFALDLIRRYVLALPVLMNGASSEGNLFLIDKSNSVNNTYEIKANGGSIEDIHTDYQNEFITGETILEEVEPTEAFLEQNEDKLEDYYYTETSSEDEDTLSEFQDTISEDKDTVLLTDIIIKNSKSEKINAKKKKSKDIFSFFKSGNKLQKSIKITLTCFVALLLVGLIISSAFFINIFRDRSQIEKAQTLYSQSDKTSVFSKLSSKNSDFKGWITIDGTKINNPVYQSDNNSYYSTYNMNKQKSRYGALFFDYRNILSGETPSQNLVIYGKNMN